mgnify:CR=1 FL=1|jgi:hypothetical protein
MEWITGVPNGAVVAVIVAIALVLWLIMSFVRVAIRERRGIRKRRVKHRGELRKWQDEVAVLVAKSVDTPCPNCGTTTRFRHPAHALLAKGYAYELRYECETCSAKWHDLETKDAWKFGRYHDMREKPCCGTCVDWKEGKCIGTPVLPLRDAHDWCRKYRVLVSDVSRPEYFKEEGHGDS